MPVSSGRQRALSKSSRAERPSPESPDFSAVSRQRSVVAAPATARGPRCAKSTEVSRSLDPDQDAVAVGPRFIQDWARPVPPEIGGGHAESFVIDARLSHGVLQCGAFERDEPERHVRLDETPLLHLMHENAKSLQVTDLFMERLGLSSHDTTRRFDLEHRSR